MTNERDREEGSSSGLRIRDFSLARELFQFALVGAVVALGVARGFWDLVALAFVAFAFVLSNIARRVEWSGRSLSPRAVGPSVLHEGLRALPRDILTLSLIVVVFPASAIAVVVLYGDLGAWIGMGVALLTTFAASIALGLEIRRRLAERDQRS